MGRLKKNLAYFRVNYVLAVSGGVVVAFFFNPYSLLVLGGLAIVWAIMFGVRKAPLVIAGRTLR